jgi:hypothetical protein
VFSRLARRSGTISPASITGVASGHRPLYMSQSSSEPDLTSSPISSAISTK